MQQYSLDLQQQFTPRCWSISDTFGTHGNPPRRAEEINQPIPRRLARRGGPTHCQHRLRSERTARFSLNSTCDRVLNQVKPYLGYFAIDAMRTIFSSNYNSLQTKITKHFAGKTYVDANSPGPAT